MKPKLVQCFYPQKQLGGTNDHLHLTINQEEIQDLINESVDNKIAKSFVSSLTKELDEEVKLWRNSDLNNIWTNKRRYWKKTKRFADKKKYKYNRSRIMPRRYSHVNRDST